MNNERIAYGLFEYETENVGDEIQSIAAKRFLPRVDYYFNRDDIDSTITDGRKVKLIMNGWYTHKPENWPPRNTNIDPLLISMYVERKSYSGRIEEKFISKESKKFLEKNGPVGTRDRATLDFFVKNGIDAYFSGCVTLTLKKEKNVKKRSFVLAVDVSDRVYDAIKNRTNREVRRIDTCRCVDMDRAAKFALAEYFLYNYQSAHAVVTQRLHCMLPCLALETPVLAISGREPYRYAGLIDLVNNCTEDDFLDKDYDKFNVDNPPKNPRKYLAVRKKLIETCSEFTGYDSDSGYMFYHDSDKLLESADLFEAIAKLMKNSYELEGCRYDCENQLKRIVQLEEENNRLSNERVEFSTPGIKQSSKFLVKAIIRRINKTLKNR